MCNCLCTLPYVFSEASTYDYATLIYKKMIGLLLGTGKGGTSIWNRKFEDEFHDNLKVYIKHMNAIINMLQHNARGIVSMANSGPDTNGSQFFIIYGKQPSLDMKYTVFAK